MGHHAAPRLAAFDSVGLHRYSLTFCTLGRLPWFEEPSNVQHGRTLLMSIMGKHRFSVPAYCFMPDHAHVLLSAEAESCALVPAVHCWKQATGYAHKRAHSRRLWQTGFYDHVLRADADALATAAYIVGNPVRAGLAKSVLEYPHCGSSLYSLSALADAIQSGRCRKHG